MKRTFRFLWPLLVVLSSVAWLAAVAGWFRGARRVPVLREAAEAEKPIDRYPSVSVVVAAREEETGVGEALSASSKPQRSSTRIAFWAFRMLKTSARKLKVTGPTVSG